MKTTKKDEKHWVEENKRIDVIYNSKEFKMPVHYIFALTNDCNLNCSFCFLNHNVENELSLSDWIKIVKQLPSYARVVFFGGEPLLYKEFNKIYEIVSSRFPCTIVTNGTLLDENIIDLLLSTNGLKNIFISIDDIGNHNRDFSKQQWLSLIQSIDEFNKRRILKDDPPKLGINTVILDDNADDLFKLHKYCHEKLSCDYMNYCLLNGSSMQLSDDMQSYDALSIEEESPGYEKWSIVLKRIEEIREYNKQRDFVSYFRPKIFDINSDDSLKGFKNLKSISDNKKYGPCKIPWADCRIHPNGDVSPCLAVSFGNVKENSLERVLNSEMANRFKKHILSNRFYKQCKRCVMRYDQKFYIDN